MPRVTRSLNQGASVSNRTQQLLTPWSDTVTPCVRGDPDRDWWPVVDIKGEVWKNLEGSDKSLSDPPPDPRQCVWFNWWSQPVLTRGKSRLERSLLDKSGPTRGHVTQGDMDVVKSRKVVAFATECSFVWGHSMLWFSKDGQSMPWVHQDLIFHSKWIISYSILYLVCPYSRSWSRSQQWGSGQLNNPFILIHLSLNKVPAFFFFVTMGGNRSVWDKRVKKIQHSNCCATVCALN